MRLSADQIALIRSAVTTVAGEPVKIYVFGSRLRDDARGGDLDLYVESTDRLSLLQRARIKLSLEQGLGMPVDIVVSQLNAERTPFQNIARLQGVLI